MLNNESEHSQTKLKAALKLERYTLCSKRVNKTATIASIMIPLSVNSKMKRRRLTLEQIWLRERSHTYE